MQRRDLQMAEQAVAVILSACWFWSRRSAVESSALSGDLGTLKESLVEALVAGFESGGGTGGNPARNRRY